MAVLQAAQIADLVTSTLRDLGKMKFTDITSTLQRKIAMSRLMKKSKVTFGSGYEYQWNIMYAFSDSARFVGLGAPDNVNIPDVMTTGSAPWRHVTASWAVIRQVVTMNQNPARIVDYVTEQRLACLIGMAEKFEDRFWRVPAANDTVNPYGVPYWIVKSNTAGFNGGAPTGYTLVGNVNPSIIDQWKNYTDQYAAVSKDDLIRKWRKAATFCEFEPSIDGMPLYTNEDSPGYYTNYNVIGQLEEALEAQNDNLGNDVASMDGRVLFRRNPVVWVPKLEADTTDPVYGINWADFKTAVLSGEWMNETRLPVTPGQHTVASNFVDCSMNWFTRNRRRQFVIAKNTGLPTSG